MSSSTLNSIRAYVPEMPKKETLVAAGYAAGGAVFYIATDILEDFLDEAAYKWASSTFLGKVVTNAIPITTTIAAITTIYSTYKLCEKSFAEKESGASKTSIAVGVVALAVANVARAHFSEKAWDLDLQSGCSKLAWGAVSLGYSASSIVSVSLLVFTLYATYSFLKAAHATPEDTEL